MPTMEAGAIGSADRYDTSKPAVRHRQRSHFRAGQTVYSETTAWLQDQRLMSFFLHRVPATVGRCLELASGNAPIARAALHLGLGRSRWVAADSERAMLPDARSGVVRVVADGCQLPFESRSMELVVCRSGLHYIGAKRGFEEMHRVMQPGGRAVVAQKVADDMRDDLDWYAAAERARSVLPREWYFSDNLLRMARSAGLELVEKSLHRATYRTSLSAWASRDGHLPASSTDELLRLADRGRDADFANRTGFRMLDDGELEVRMLWLLLLLVSAPASPGVRAGSSGMPHLGTRADGVWLRDSGK